MISALLVSHGNEIAIKGPVQLTVPLPYHTHLQSSDTIPAWTFDMTTGDPTHLCLMSWITEMCCYFNDSLLITGSWVNKGLGSVRMEKNGLVWTFVAPHVGIWIAAPSPSSGNTIHDIVNSIMNIICPPAAL